MTTRVSKFGASTPTEDVENWINSTITEYECALYRLKRIVSAPTYPSVFIILVFEKGE